MGHEILLIKIFATSGKTPTKARAVARSVQLSIIEQRRCQRKLEADVLESLKSLFGALMNKYVLGVLEWQCEWLVWEFCAIKSAMENSKGASQKSGTFLFPRELYHLDMPNTLQRKHMPAWTQPCSMLHFPTECPFQRNVQIGTSDEPYEQPTSRVTDRQPADWLYSCET